MLCAGVACVPMLAGCGREKPREELTFERLPDTTGLSAGAAILERFETYRTPEGAVRVAGDLRLPDSTRLEVAIRAPGGGSAVAMAHVVVLDGKFDTPPMLGENGPLPVGEYRLEVLVHFDADWQPARVLRATANGRSLRGPGITRARNGDAALFLTREGRL